MYFGMFGSIFLLSQFFQVVQGYSPFEAGLRMLPWTAMPVVVAPIAGVFAGRIGGRPILVVGHGAHVDRPRLARGHRHADGPVQRDGPPFIVSGIGMGMFFAPIANVVLSAVRPEEEGKASGATNTIREIGGVFGVAVLAAIFSANGVCEPAAYVSGLSPAIAVGAAVVGGSARWLRCSSRAVRGHGLPCSRSRARLDPAWASRPMPMPRWRANGVGPAGVGVGPAPRLGSFPTEPIRDESFVDRWPNGAWMQSGRRSTRGLCNKPFRGEPSGQQRAPRRLGSPSGRTATAGLLGRSASRRSAELPV